jgi:hypothetical protein
LEPEALQISRRLGNFRAVVSLNLVHTVERFQFGINLTSPLLFNFALEYAIRKAKETPGGTN